MSSEAENLDKCFEVVSAVVEKAGKVFFPFFPLTNKQIEIIIIYVKL